MQVIVSGDVFMMFISQIRDQIFKEKNKDNETLRQTTLTETGIYDENFYLDFMTSAPGGFIEEMQRDLRR
jgi:hypothetical protein